MYTSPASAAVVATLLAVTAAALTCVYASLQQSSCTTWPHCRIAELFCDECTVGTCVRGRVRKCEREMTVKVARCAKRAVERRSSGE